MATDFIIEKTTNSRLASVDFSNIQFGHTFADHMLECDYADGKWGAIHIKPYGKLLLSPATTALHYGQSIFEGQKAYRLANGEAAIFRPKMNWERFNKSAKRMCMPEIPQDIFVEGMRKLVGIDKDWISPSKGGSLYIRPFMFATDEYVGIRPSEHYKFIIFCSPVNAYYNDPVKVKIEQHYVRASEGGVGEAKNAGNYGASLYPASLGQAQGYRQLLWTDGKEHKWIEESGTMNVFFVIGDKVITPNLDGSILDGVTRNSVITLLKDKGITVEERRISVDEVVEASRNNTLKDMFGAGTAATIAPIVAIGYNDGELVLPPMETREISTWLLDTLNGIRYGTKEDKFGWMIPALN
ncbi:MAG: branched-chain amino acid aminotransferase [Bacteroidetes bacterium]|nr:branched-chain amino acid aminotransferase [Bacteroidota bacterium]